jgi:hypothetical protein
MRKVICKWSLFYKDEPLEYFETKKTALYWFFSNYEKSFKSDITLKNEQTKKIYKLN